MKIKKLIILRKIARIPVINAFWSSLKRTSEGFIFWLTSLIGNIPSHLARNFFYSKILGMKIGKSSTIYSKAEIRSANKIIIGKNSIIGHNAILDGRKSIEIGENVNFSTGVWVWTVQHDPQSPSFGVKSGSVVIEDYCWISARVIILPGVVIGKGSVICAGSVVTKSIPPFSIVGGVPGKIIGKRNTDLSYKLSSKEALPFI